MGNIALFFCLYHMGWANPPMCNSSHLRLIGFFSALPGIWRALQCLRRYRDTGNVFPHLANCGKYTFTILFYMSLSLYRIDKTHQLRAFFIFCATINSVYCSLWDLIMDWSRSPFTLLLSYSPLTDPQVFWTSTHPRNYCEKISLSRIRGGTTAP
jgi:hypothetical protein